MRRAMAKYILTLRRFYKNKRYAEVKTHSLQDTTVTSIEFPLHLIQNTVKKKTLKTYTMWRKRNS